MTPNISAIEIDIKINNYVALHPELRGKEKAYIISIMLKNFALTTEEAKKLQESSIYSNPFSQANGEYISPLANDNFIASNTDENTNTEEKNNIISTIANIKVDSDGKVDRRQFTVKELLKKYEPPEYKIERNINDKRSSYADDDDTMNVTMYQITQDTIIHELGHAIDNIRLNTNSKDTNIEQESRWITNDPDILKIYSQEKENYISAGNQAYNEEDVLDKETKTWNTTVTEGPYCTWNIKEFFAESYGLMMLESPSDHNSIECIEKYFPKTFAAVKAKLKQVRKMSAEERHYC